MLRIPSALAGSLLLLFPAPVSGRATPPPVDLTAQVDEIFAPLDTRQKPGCAVAVGKEGQPLVSRAYGMADLEHDVPNTPGTVFEAGSVSKQFTAAAVLLLVQQGKLSLQDDVRKHVPELPVYEKTITLDHLLHHTSGLRDWGSVAELAGWPRGTRVHTHDHVLDIASRQRSLNYEPGLSYSYTNTGFNLLVIIAERVSGQSFQEFSRRNLFEPLGMTRTQWRDDFSRIVKGRAIAYSERDGEFHLQMPFENVFGNGGLLTTVGDLLLWNEGLVQGKIGGPGFLQEMERRGRLSTGQEIEYASGLFMTSWNGVTEISHSGATAGYRAFLARYPEQKLSVAVLCNGGEINPTDLARRTAGLFLGEIRLSEPRVEPSSKEAVLYERAPGELAGYVGEYRSDEAEVTYRVVLEDGKLFLRSRPAASYPLTPLDADAFQAEGGLKVRFRRDTSGEVSELSLGTPRVWDLRLARQMPRNSAVLIEKVTVVSPEREAPLKDAFVLLEGDRIRSVGTERPAVAEDVRVIDGRGRFLVPGLIDSHVHLGTPAGVNVAAMDTEDFDKRYGPMIEEYWRQQPRSYLYHGVTTVVDLASPPGSAERFRSAPQAPDLLTCAPLPLANGYPAVFVPAELRGRFLPYVLPEDPAAAVRLVQNVQKEGHRCIKIFLEDGFGGASGWPIPSEAVVAAVRAEARRLGLPVVLHANALDMQTLALQHKPDVLAHGLWNWGASSHLPELPEPIRKHLDAVLASGAAYQPTFGVLDGLAGLFEPAFLDDPALKKVVPPSLLAWYRTDEAQFFKKDLVSESPELADPVIARKVFGEAVSQGERAFSYLAGRGARILLGSDTPSAPIWTNQPGLNTWKELRHMALEGLPLREILKAATIRNAEVFHLQDLGTVEPGKVANLLLLRSDPLASVEAWNDIETVILHGEMVPRESLAMPGS